MAVAEDRAVITDTLNGLTGLTGSPTSLTVKENLNNPKPGVAVIQLTGIDYTAGIAEPTWRIYIYLAQNESNAMAWFEANAEALRLGLQRPELPLESAGYVDSINTVNLGTNDSPVYGLEITLRS